MGRFMRLSEILKALDIQSKNPDGIWRTSDEIDADLEIAYEKLKKEYEDLISES